MVIKVTTRSDTQSGGWMLLELLAIVVQTLEDDAILRLSSCASASNSAADRPSSLGIFGTMYQLQGQGGKPQLLSANAGDARVILARGGKGLQLSEDHTPDV